MHQSRHADTQRESTDIVPACGPVRHAGTPSHFRRDPTSGIIYVPRESGVQLTKAIRLVEMATGTDQVAGYSLVGLALAIFSYYTVWVIVLPFVDSDQSIHTFFPPRFYAIAGPLVAGVVALILIGAFFAFVSMRRKKQKKS